MRIVDSLMAIVTEEENMESLRLTCICKKISDYEDEHHMYPNVIIKYIALGL
jgi:hypothetical protein